MLSVLVVAPRFPPSNAADAHRVRLLIPYLQAYGCLVQVLAVDPRDMAVPVDPWLSARLPQQVPVHRVRAWPTAGWGLNGLAQRSVVPLYQLGSRLIASSRFDLVFFSTTEFLVHILGPIWLHRFDVPFCMDYQDPWVGDYYRDNPGVVPPGGRLKFGLIDRLHRAAERFVAPRCAGFLAVSEPYLNMLDQRYGAAVSTQPRLVQPFPGEPAEFDHRTAVGQSGAHSGCRPRIIRYVGRGGPDMRQAARAFFSAWRSLIDEGVLQPEALRFEAIGTSYAAAGRGTSTFLPIAGEFVLAHMVSESPDRLGYRATLERLRTSDALVVFGSDDPGYTASKIYPYLLARRPLLAIVRRESSVVNVIEEVGGAQCVTFGASGCDTQPVRAFLVGVANGAPPQPFSYEAFEPYTARAQAKQLVAWFASVIEHARRGRRVAVAHQ